MLITFKVANYRSIREELRMSMVPAAATKEHVETHTTPSGIKDPDRLLRSAVIYGPNAAGKTNVLKALQFMQGLVISSALAPPTAANPYDPFKLSSATREAPSEFEVAFVQEDTLYEYGFKLTAKRVCEEWLHEYPRARGRRLFYRKYDDKKDEYDWSFSPLFKGNRLLWRDSTRANALFLSTAAQLNSVQLLPVSAWFQRRLVFIPGISSFNASLTLNLLGSPEGKSSLLPFVREADPGIADVELQREALPGIRGRPPGIGAGTMMIQGPNLSGAMLFDQQSPDNPPSIVRVSFAHNSVDGNDSVKIDMSQESAGTQALFVTAGAWLNVLRNGEVLLFDEIDTSLHPLLTRFLVGQFHSNQTNPNSAQLIFSTHDTTLLSHANFRRDQIWFVEKGEDNATKLYPLTDFSPRKDEAYERAYLRGRYGALPIFSEIPS
jgi:AAA15 family ATPase/GTPase